MKINRKGLLTSLVVVGLLALKEERDLSKKARKRKLTPEEAKALADASGTIDYMEACLRELASHGVENGGQSLDELGSWPDRDRCSDMLGTIMAYLTSSSMVVGDFDPETLDLSLIRPGTLKIRHCDPDMFIV
jgi:hypothetical protein